MTMPRRAETRQEHSVEPITIRGIVEDMLFNGKTMSFLTGVNAMGTVAHLVADNEFFALWAVGAGIITGIFALLLD